MSPLAKTALAVPRIGETEPVGSPTLKEPTP